MARTPEQNNAIITGNIPRQLLLFFFPIWLGTMFQQLYNTVDTLIVGNFVGTQALAAVGATSSFVQLLVGLFVGLCSGAGVIIAQSFGAGDHDEVNRQVHTALALAIAGGAALTVIGLLISRPVLRLMQTPDEIVGMASEYLQIYFLGMIPQMIYNMGTNILRGGRFQTAAVLFDRGFHRQHCAGYCAGGGHSAGGGRRGHCHGGQPGGQRCADSAVHPWLPGHAVAFAAQKYPH